MGDLLEKSGLESKSQSDFSTGLSPVQDVEGGVHRVFAGTSAGRIWNVCAGGPGLLSEMGVLTLWEKV